ncbi:unnamed protein product [Caenorhabditis auriculariae]|uniref:Uncharacterized protein n=1 Tax=Caenorhabditis auriculariae TaxID=2777116 RepID=A0A8S1HU45_9PELO|nr:unnamed protein product [Caenorhabditis auriculariae]
MACSPLRHRQPCCGVKGAALRVRRDIWGNSYLFSRGSCARPVWHTVDYTSQKGGKRGFSQRLLVDCGVPPWSKEDRIQKIQRKAMTDVFPRATSFVLEEQLLRRVRQLYMRLAINALIAELRSALSQLRILDAESRDGIFRGSPIIALSASRCQQLVREARAARVKVTQKFFVSTVKHKSVIFDATVKKEIEAHSNKTLLWPAG